MSIDDSRDEIDLHVRNSKINNRKIALDAIWFGEGKLIVQENKKNESKEDEYDKLLGMDGNK